MKKNIIYIIGHKNPDIDSVCSAISYAYLKNIIDPLKKYIPISCGEINNKIKNLLHFFNVDIPIFKTNFYTTLNNIKNKLELAIKEDITYSDILKNNLYKNIDFLPIIDNEYKIKGYINKQNIEKYFFNLMKKIFLYSNIKINNNFNLKLNINKLKINLKSYLIKNNNIENIENFEIIFSSINIKKENKNIILIVDKEDDCLRNDFIDQRVKLIIVKNLNTKEKYVFQNNKINLLLTNNNETKIILILLESCQITSFLEKELSFCFNNEEKIIDIQKKLIENDYFKKNILFSIINNNNKVIGFFDKENLNENLSNEIILVDHNEKSQSIDGIEFCNIIEIIDHHRLSNEATINPIKFINEPIGSTCTIIAEMFYQNKINIDKKIAGLLISGIVSDTINLKSPTTTERDKKILKWLQSIYHFNLDEIIKVIFYSYSILKNEPMENIIKYDCKIYKELNISFSISQVEEVSFNNFFEKYEEILKYMNIFMINNNLDFSIFFITNINNNSSLLLISENTKYNIKKHINYPSIDNQKIIFELKNIVSRKKQLTPYIINIIKKLL